MADGELWQKAFTFRPEAQIEDIHLPGIRTVYDILGLRSEATCSSVRRR